jgi:ribosomal protein L11 methyltransferase
METVMDWTQLKATCNVADLDTVCAVMSMLENGLQIEDYSDIETGLKTVYGELIDEQILNSDKTIASVSIYLSSDQSLAEAISFLQERFLESGVTVSLTHNGVKEEDWADSWKQYYKPVAIGEHIVVVPMWEEYDAKEDDVILKMDPGMAFGTGTHETTRLCAALVEKHCKSGEKVLDIGTGSGILAILASKLGASHVDAYDIDPVAVRVAKENVRDNGVCNVECGVSDLLLAVKGKYDFVCANIVADIIVRMAPDISAYMNDGARLVTSGIIEGQTERVKNALLQDKSLVLIDSKIENDWHAFVFEKRA